MAAVAASTRNLNKQRENASASVLQDSARKRFTANMRLHRKNLGERLLFESKVLWETARFVNQALIFAFLMLALRFSSKEVQKRGVYDGLADAFDFESLQAYQDRQTYVEEGLPSISSSSKDYFLRSSMYFDDNGAGGTILLRDVFKFAGPKFGGQLNLNGGEFSFTAWVRTSASFGKGGIVRKGLKTVGEGSETLSCWSWFLHGTYGQQLHFGGHDYFATPDKFPASSSGKQQEELPDIGSATWAPTPGEWAFLTLSVTSTHATFYHMDTEVGSVSLPRPLVDCLNTGGIELGAAGMELGAVRYHRAALVAADIVDLMSAGGELADIARGSEPTVVDPSDIQVLDGSLASSFSALSRENNARQRVTEANFVLHDATPTDAATYQSPMAPLGTAAVNQTERTDGARKYVQLAAGPERMTSTDGKPEDQHRYLTDWPSFRGTGATFSFWYRHSKPCIEATDPCGLYLLDARDDTTQCWALWLQSNELRFWVSTPDAANSGFLDTVPTESKYTFLNGKTWRHVAMVLDESSDEVHIYLDGHLAATRAWGSAVAQADCSTADKRMAFGHAALPGFTYGLEVEMYDFRMYTHGAGGALTAAEIAALAGDQGATAALGGEEYQCLEISNPAMQEKQWADKYGHTCSWYAENVQAFAGICDYPGAADNCPNACKSRQECWLDAQSAKAYYTWNGIQRVDPNQASKGGALCLASGLSKAEVQEECESWVAGGGATSAAVNLWLTSFEGAKGTRIDLRDCEAVAAAVHENCAFDAEAVKKFTEESQANNGDFSIAFWVQPLGQSSLQPESGRFIPHIQFLSSISPPTHNMAWGLWENPNGEVRLFSDCQDAMENIEMKAASSGDWTFIAITKKNPKGGAVGDATVVTNVGTNYEGSTWAEKQCVFNAEHFFTALEINYPSNVSPIMMIPEAVPVALLQQQYLNDVPYMRLKEGPAGGSDAGDSTIPIDKEEFGKPSIMVSPPIIFQTRAEPAESCPSEFGHQYILGQHERMAAEQCATPYECDAEVLDDPGQLLACVGDESTQGLHFGNEAVPFGSDDGYADFLFSVTESIFLSRGGELFKAQDFLDRMSTAAKVMLVFFTPEAGITTVLTVEAELADSAAIEVSVGVEHFEIVEGSDLTAYLAIQILIFLPVLFMLLDVCVHFRKTAVAVIEQKREDIAANLKAKVIRNKALGKTGAAAVPSLDIWFLLRLLTEMLGALKMLFLDLVDLAIAGLVIVYVILRIPATLNSADDAERVVGQLGIIDWASRSEPLQSKMSDFFDHITELNDLLMWHTFLNRLCNFVLILSLLRLLKCTSMHPRLALLEGTIVKAWDDLWHSAILITLLMTCFAGIGTWRFGSERPDFADFETSLQKLFEMTFGEFPDDWTESFDLRLFTVLYLIIVFLLVQNFLLAVIVEAYMGVRADNEALETEQEFLLDIWSSMHGHYLALRHGWPTPFRLGNELNEWIARRSVGYRDLDRTGMFRNKESVVKFIKHYRGFSFLEPVKFNEYGPEITNENDRMVHELEMRMAKQQGVKVPTLKEFAEETLQKAKNRAGVPRARANGVPGMNGNGQQGYPNGGALTRSLPLAGNGVNRVHEAGSATSSDMAFYMPPGAMQYPYGLPPAVPGVMPPMTISMAGPVGMFNGAGY